MNPYDVKSTTIFIKNIFPFKFEKKKKNTLYLLNKFYNQLKFNNSLLRKINNDLTCEYTHFKQAIPASIVLQLQKSNVLEKAIVF